MAAQARVIEVRRKDVFFREGEPARVLFALFSGRAKLSRLTPEGQEIIIRMIGAGEVCGVFGALVDEVYSITATALEHSHALIWNKEYLDDLFRRCPVLSRNALGIVAQHLRDLEERYRELATEKVPQRLAHTLLRFVRPAGRPSEESVPVDIPVSREDLAQMTGTTLFTVSRLLSHWVHQGILTAGRQRVRIENPRSLFRLAEDPPSVANPNWAE